MSPKARRYSMPVVVRARELRDLPMSLQATAEQLAKEFGVPVMSKDTILYWTDPGYRERKLERDAKFHRAHGARSRPFRPRLLTDLDLLALRVDDELTYTSISKVVKRFYGVSLSAEQVRWKLYKLGVQRNPNRVAANDRRVTA